MDKLINTITYDIAKKDEKSFIFIPFTVPENVDSMTINISWAGDDFKNNRPTEEKNLFDFGIINCDGIEIGATGSAYKTITISPYYSTDGYKRVDIKSGEWKIILGVYLIKNEGAKVTYNIEYKFKEYQWLKGDIHLHTTNSDGKLSIFELIQGACKKKLDFIAITDHNNNTADSPIPRIAGITVIKGVELTHYRGHMNMYGVTAPYSKTYGVNTNDDFFSLVNEANENGAILSMNHPFDVFCPWLFPFDGFNYNCIEVWNGPMRLDNMKNLAYWEKMLLEGNYKVLVGGSDFHEVYAGFVNLIANPTIYVYSLSKSSTDILDAIKNGRVFVTNSTKSSQIYLSIDNKVIGQTVDYRDNLKAELKIIKLKKKHKLIVYNNNKIIHTYIAKNNKDYYVELDKLEKGYIRAEIRYNKRGISKSLHKLIEKIITKKNVKDIPEFIYAITNPIFVK